MSIVIILQDMIHIADTKVARRYGDFFIRQIHKFEEVRIFLKFRAHYKTKHVNKVAFVIEVLVLQHIQ